MTYFDRIRSGAFVIKDKKILLFKRPQGYWYFPEGKIENNETAEHAAIRETKEETGIKIKIKKLLYVHELRKKDHRTIELIYLAKPIGGKFRKGIDPRENKRLVELKYMPLTSISKLDFLFPNVTTKVKNDIKNEFRNCPRGTGISKVNLKKLLGK